MKILICAAFYRPHVGGYEKNVEIMAQRLAKNGHEVDILTCNTNKSFAYEGKVKESYLINRVPCWNLLNGAYPVPKLSANLKSVMNHKYDLVMTQTRFFITSLIGYLISKKQKIPLIAVERGTCHSVTKNALVSLLCRVYDHAVGTLIARHAKVNVGVSQAACNFVKHIGGKNTRVIYNGIDCDPARTVLNKTQSKEKYITFVGRLIYAKGVQDLINAYCMCVVDEEVVKLVGTADGKPNLRLRIIGDGPYREELENIWHGEPVRLGWIKFYGERRDVIDILEESDIFVNPSYSEGLPTSVMEAASVGLPIIATDVGGTKEIIKHGKSGFVIIPHKPHVIAEFIKVILKDEAAAKSMGVMAKNTVMAKFNWDSIEKQYENLIKEVTK
jgi:glycosyltransferase involved in cell wall biosynthesis